MNRRVATLLGIAIVFVIAGALPGNAAPPIKVPGQIPLMNVMGPPGTLATDDVGAPGQSPVRFDAKIEGTMRPVHEKTRPTFAHKMIYKQPVAGECSPGWRYDMTGSAKERFKQGTDTTVIQNHGNTTVEYTIKLTKAGSVSFGVNGAVEVEAGFIISKVKARFGYSVEKTVSWDEQQTLKVPVPPHTTRYVSYGAMRLVVTGHYYYVNEYCEITRDKGSVTTMSPYHRQWNVK